MHPSVLSFWVTLFTAAVVRTPHQAGFHIVPAFLLRNYADVVYSHCEILVNPNF
jgi:hypothetical protein